MELQRLEARVIEIADAVLAGRPIEDDRVELKTTWPEAAHKTARQMAGHANASGGEPILWVIGLNERGRALGDASDVEPANWWMGTRRWFDDVAPDLRTLAVAVRPGRQVVALQFTTDRAPYLVTTKDGGQVTREVPWREGNSTRTAHRHELLRSVIAEASVPRLELIECELVLSQFLPQNTEYEYRDDHGRPLEVGEYQLRCEMHMFLSASAPANLPEYRQELTVHSATAGQIDLGPFDLKGPFRYTGYSKTGGRTREPAGAILVLRRSGLMLEGSGEVSLWARRAIGQEEGAALRRARRLEARLRLPVDGTSRATTLTSRLAYVAGSAEDPASRPGYESWVVRARFRDALVAPPGS